MIKRDQNQQSTSYIIDGVMLENPKSGKYYDLTEALVGLELNESISGLMYGKLVVINKSGLFEQISIEADNTLKIKMYSTSKHKKEGKRFIREFVVDQYSDIFSHQSNTGNTELIFKSKGEYNNTFKRVSKSYKNAGTHTIVSDMLKLVGYTDEEMNIETTMYNRDIVIPSLTPLETIGFMKGHSVSGETKNKCDSNFYFFESRDKVNFISLSSMLNRDPVATYNVCYDQSGLQHNTAITFTLDRAMNTTAQAKNGAYGITVVSHSLVDKSIKHNRMTPDNIEQTFKPMTANKAVNVSYNASNVIRVESEDQMYQFQNVGSNGNSVAIREITGSRMMERKAQMRIGADSDITVGDKITLFVDGSNGNSKASGDWLVAEIKHMITKESWIMDMVLVSDGIKATMKRD